MTTAMAVQMMNRGTRFSIKVGPASSQSSLATAATRLEVLGGAVLRSRFVVSLPSGIVSGAELIFLLIEHFAAAIDPIICLRPRGACPVANELASLFGLGQQSLASLIPGARSIQHPSHRTYSQTR